MEYKDLNGCVCRLFFEKGQSQIESRHVLVIGKHNGKWLLTRHSVRGLEFPGVKPSLANRWSRRRSGKYTKKPEPASMTWNGLLNIRFIPINRLAKRYLRPLLRTWLKLNGWKRMDRY